MFSPEEVVPTRETVKGQKLEKSPDLTQADCTEDMGMLRYTTFPPHTIRRSVDSTGVGRHRFQSSQQ